MAAMPSVVQLARRAWASAQAIDRAGSNAIATRFIRDRLAQAMPLAQKRADGSAPVLFEGTADRVTFVAPSVNGPTGTGLFVFDARATRSTAGQMGVLLAWRPFAPTLEVQGVASTGERIVLSDVASFGLRYFGQTSSTSERQWSETWPRSSFLPELVELTLMTRDALAAKPAPMVIELLAQDVAAER